MARAMEMLRVAPGETLSLIEIADERFGTQSEARRVLEIRALVGVQRIGLARAKAEAFYCAYPSSPEAEAIEDLTGAHGRWCPGFMPI